MFAACCGLVGFCPALLVLITAGFVISGGRRVVMVFTSRPQESASELFLNELLGLFRHPPGSGRALLAGTLPLGIVLLSVCK